MQAKIWKILGVIGAIAVVYLLVVLLLARPTPPKAAPVALEFWNVFDTTDTVKPLLEKFEKQTGIKVNYRSFTDLADYRDTLINELAAGEGPDVLALHQTWLGKNHRILAPAPAELITPENVAKTFVPAVAEGVLWPHEPSAAEKKQAAKNKQKPATTYDILGLPLSVDTLALYYNERIFRNVLAKPYPRPEETWAGVRADVAKLAVPNAADPAQLDLSGIALGRTDNLARGLDVLYALYRQFGGQGWVAADGRVTAAGEQATSADGQTGNPAGAALDFFTRFARNSKYPEYSWNAEMGQAPEKELDEFARGRVAMVPGYAYTRPQIENLLAQHRKNGTRGVPQPGDVQVAPFPQLADPRAGNPKVALANYFVLGVAKNSRHIPESWQLILQLVGRESQQQYFDATGRPSLRRDLLEAESKDARSGVFAGQAAYATVMPVVDDGKYATAANAVVTALNSGELKPSQAAAALGAALGCLFSGEANCHP